MPNPKQSYSRLQGQLSQLIASMPSGGQLPSEPDLAKKLSVSRATLREAMRTFEGQGLIRRRQGVGTFVVGTVPMMDNGLEVLQSIEKLAAGKGLKISMGDLRISRVPADEVMAKIFNIPANTDVIYVERVILADGHPIAYLVDRLPENVLTHADLEEGFTGSVLDLLIERGSPQLSKSYTEINAVAATPGLAKALQIQRGDVLERLVGRLYDIEGRVIDFSGSYFLPGYFKFHVVRRIG